MRLTDNTVKEALLNRKKISRKSWSGRAYAIYDFDTGYVNWWRNPTTPYLRGYELDFCVEISDIIRNCPQYGLMDGYCIIGWCLMN